MWHDTVVFGATISEFEVLVQRLASAYLRFYFRRATKFAAQPKYFKTNITNCSNLILCVKCNLECVYSTFIENWSSYD